MPKLWTKMLMSTLIVGFVRRTVQWNEVSIHTFLSFNQLCLREIPLIWFCTNV